MDVTAARTVDLHLSPYTRTTFLSLHISVVPCRAESPIGLRAAVSVAWLHEFSKHVDESLRALRVGMASLGHE
jgi:hypothetical protein